MSMSSPLPIPATPRVISPSPDVPDRPQSERKRTDYFADIGGLPPTFQSQATGVNKSPKNSKKIDHSAEPEFRARSRSRDDDASIRRRRASGLIPLIKEEDSVPTASGLPVAAAHIKTDHPTASNGYGNGHLSPTSAVANYWRNFSRSPSPLGLIPIHREWRSFIHRHEIPRKALHVSIGFLIIFFYTQNYQPPDFNAPILGLLVPITLVDILRHNWPPFNRFYIRIMGAFMRESEAHEKYNGVIWFLGGTYLVLCLYPKDVCIMCVCLLSWCDTAASTFGRMWGRYTPRIRRGKSLAGSLAAFVFGFATAMLFWGWIGPRYERSGMADNTGSNAFAFQGSLTWPRMVRQVMGDDEGAEKNTISGLSALVVMSLWTGFIVSASEAVDLFGLDDNITIPVLCGVGITGFTKLFGAA